MSDTNKKQAEADAEARAKHDAWEAAEQKAERLIILPRSAPVPPVDAPTKAKK